MSRDFYPFVEGSDPSQDSPSPEKPLQVLYAARIAVYDDAAAAPRVVVIEPKPVREYLEEITSEVTRLSHEQGGTIPFMVIREIVENFIHAYFVEPTVSILDHGNTIRFSDQGPGIREKKRALEYGTSSATEEMRRYIRGVGSGLPYAQQYMSDKGGTLRIDDNIGAGTVVTISMGKDAEDGPEEAAGQGTMAGATPQQMAAPYQVAPQQMPYGYGQMPAWQQPNYQQPSYQQPSYQQPSYQQPSYQQAGWQQPQYQSPYGYPMQGAPQGYPSGAGSWQPQPYQQMPQQQMPQPMGYQQQGAPQAPQQQAAPTGAPEAGSLSKLHISDRGSQVLGYLAQHESVGPSNLVRAFGGSQPTWSRELKELEGMGLIKKDGQKYYLTEVGTLFLNSR